jgi:ribosomal protein S18 acetylase RimI-like enzyme
MITLTADAWLSGIMARPVHRVAVGPTGARGISGPRGFYYARVPASDVAAVHELSALGFRPVDTGMTLEGKVIAGARSEPASVREARPEDRAGVTALARRGFSQSRFHLDPDIPKSLADEIKAQWAGNYFAGKRGDHMIVCDGERGLAGFLQLLDADDGSLVIDLIAVDADHRGRGLGTAMIRKAAGLSRNGRMRVGTQAANTGSLNLYENLGFRTVASAYVMHLHA